MTRLLGRLTRGMRRPIDDYDEAQALLDLDYTHQFGLDATWHHSVRRADLRGAAGLARIVAEWAPDLDPTERAEVQRIGARLAELADHKEAAADAAIDRA